MSAVHEWSALEWSALEWSAMSGVHEWSAMEIQGSMHDRLLVWSNRARKGHVANACAPPCCFFCGPPVHPHPPHCIYTCKSRRTFFLPEALNVPPDAQCTQRLERGANVSWGQHCMPGQQGAGRTSIKKNILEGGESSPGDLHM